MSSCRTKMVYTVITVSAMCVASASAAVLFETTPDFSGNTGAAFSNSVSGTGQLYASSFMLDADANVTGFTWMGVNTGDMSNVSSFNLEIWSNTLLYDVYDVPGERLASWTVPLADANMFNTGQQIYNLDVYSFAAGLDSQFAIEAGQTYWLTVYGNSEPSSMFAWLYASPSPVVDGATYSVQGVQGAQWWSATRETTFSVIGDIAPEPTTMGLLALGSLVMLRRQRPAQPES
ncbi:MAG TPA: PEP-CTERM sorting domain-containing protein [Phycisphaerae bacterium]|jgi:hypothetical protein|nr:PEP-CTERM sorting domain-containing protein [Phycisphaerae bacterium]HOB73180.1 PEP-CTERM sorting domain-containing protein [Phycisphaerae bacterium]HOJ53351.1 PEP-CTERM sorting domain-containing protein [Phycisphaerae bacterium]HOL27237.1 PEP-CTERM sorting domain-containing protein [Phycisphaerae bacterium]HPP21797.1 PEP-CTERM sorting domain-containing protein [Phycisphaerae bacterium]